MWFRDGCDKQTASTFVQILEEVWLRPWQWLDKHLETKAWAVKGKSKISEIKKGKADEKQGQEHAHYFLSQQGDCSQRIHPGRPNSQLHILLCHFMVTAWKFAANYGNKRTGCCIMTMQCLTLPLSPGNFLPKINMTIVPNLPYFSVSPIEDKLTGHQSDTIVMIKAES
jgi:hypothetical protein